MRITNNMIARGMMSNLNAHLRRMDQLHYQMSSGKRLRVPSDDPAATSISMRLHSDLLQTKQHRANISSALSWLQATDAALNEVSEALHRAKDLAIYGANGVLPQDAREALAAEVDQIVLHMIDLGNASQAGLYLFSGNETLTQPYALASDDPPTVAPYAGDDGVRSYEISEGVTVGVNVPGGQLFDDIFSSLLQLRDALYDGDLETIGGDAMRDLDGALDGLLRVRADVGARLNRLELAAARMHELELSVEQLIADTEGVDIAKVIIDLKVSENAYRSALASGARIIQPTLLDFLR